MGCQTANGCINLNVAAEHYERKTKKQQTQHQTYTMTSFHELKYVHIFLKRIKTI